MTQALMKPSRTIITPMIGESHYERVRHEGVPIKDDRDVLRALVDELDILGTDADGAAWAVIRTTPELLQYLAEMDAGIEDAEEDDFSIHQVPRMVHEEDEDNGDAEDSGDYEPEYR